MDWISFSWGVGTIIFVNIVLTTWFLPKQLKKIGRLEKRESDLQNRLESIILGYEEGLVSLQKDRDKVMSSLKLMKSCPACGTEFPLYRPQRVDLEL